MIHVLLLWGFELVNFITCKIHSGLLKSILGGRMALDTDTSTACLRSGWVTSFVVLTHFMIISTPFLFLESFRPDFSKLPINYSIHLTPSKALTAIHLVFTGLGRNSPIAPWTFCFTSSASTNLTLMYPPPSFCPIAGQQPEWNGRLRSTILSGFRPARTPPRLSPNINGPP